MEISLGPEYDAYPSTVDEPVAVVEDPAICARIVEALQDDGFQHDVVVQAQGSLDLVFYDADHEFMTSVTVLPGWIRYGAPTDARLASTDLESLLAELGITRPWSTEALRAVRDVESRLATTARNLPAEPETPNLLATELTERWKQQWPASRPVAHELRGTENGRWVRFHSLPEAKRYAEDEAEYQELLHRHATVISELNALSATNSRDLLIITCAWSPGPKPPLRTAPVVDASPGAIYWQSLLIDDDEDWGQNWMHLFVERTGLGEARLQLLLRIVADDVTEGVIITDPDLTWLYHPYDGGADVIAATPADRDRLRARHSDWLPSHSAGL
ncbi:MAG TPA: hypothetical protein VLL08_08645 [Kineosporiaceae bacterium]|nr:hypothetical protein [Kineosporiaceae bacterium]